MIFCNKNWYLLKYVHFEHFFVFFVAKSKVKLVLKDYQMGLLFIHDPKIAGCGKKRVAEWFGLRNAGLDY